MKIRHSREDAGRGPPWARLAGFMYLATIASYFAGSWLISNDATAGGAIDAEHARRLGLLLLLATSWGTVLLAGSLYAVLRAVDPILALFALIWRVGEAVLGALIVALRFALVTVDTQPTGEPGAAAAVAEMTVRAINGATFSVTTLFFTAGSTIFFWLFLKSRSIPRAIAAFGLIASLLFALLACASLLQLELPGPLRYAWAPMLPAEIITGLWLLLRGVDLPAQVEKAAHG